MVKKFIFLLFSFVLPFLFLIPNSLFITVARAEGEFLTDVEVQYKVQGTGKTTVTNKITVENVFSTLYVTSYALVLDNIQPENPRAYQDSKPLTLNQKKEGDKVSLQVNFDDAVVGKGKSRTFYIAFEEGSFATRTGEVWEISIPRLSSAESFRSYSVNLLVPDSFGNEAYISPKSKSFEDSGGFKSYVFDKDAVSKTGITAGFGQFQVFSFTLNYHLENPLARSAQTQIALPPDTAFQKIYYQNLDPHPENVAVDADGNWLAIYNLSPRQRIDVKAQGAVQIFAGPRSTFAASNQTLAANLEPSTYWQVDDPEIRSQSARLSTPKAIYDYVATHLKYDYQRVKPNVERIGAKAALASPKSAICMEYTDLFIALARAAGIPAREINGYAYTENPDIQPLSLVADVLHAWPEYWDAGRRAWIPIDPTWASTTGGVDYFSKLDLRHFTFVIHGADPIKPYPPGSYKLGSNPQKDVFVSFGQLPTERISYPKIEARPAPSLPFMNSKITVAVLNPGPAALYNITPTVLFDGKTSRRETVSILPPFAKYEMQILVPFSFLGTKTPNKVEILVGDKKVEIPSFKNQVMVYNLILLFLIFAIVVGFVFIRVKKITIEKIKDAARNVIKKTGG